MNPENQGNGVVGGSSVENGTNGNARYNPDGDHLVEYAQEVSEFMKNHEDFAQKFGERAIEAVDVAQGDGAEATSTVEASGVENSGNADGGTENAMGRDATSVNKPVSEAGLDEIQRRARAAEESGDYDAAMDYLRVMNGLMDLD